LRWPPSDYRGNKVTLSVLSEEISTPAREEFNRKLSPLISMV
jgi:hypothetical protein